MPRSFQIRHLGAE